MNTWTKIASDGLSPVAASKLMSCSVGEAIRQIELAKDEAEYTRDLKASVTATSWVKLASDKVPPHIAAKIRDCSVGEAIASLSKANYQISRPASERAPYDLTKKIVASQTGMAWVRPPYAVGAVTEKADRDAVGEKIGGPRAPKRTALTPSCQFTTEEMLRMTKPEGYYVDHREAPTPIV